MSAITGRRAFLGAMALAPAVALPAVAIAAPDPSRLDREFWRALAHEQRVRAQWMRSYDVMRDSPQCDAVTDRWCHRHSAAEQAVVKAPVSTLAALWAKLDMIKVNEIDYAIPHRAYNGKAAQDVILFDVMRMIAREKAA